MAKTLLNKGKKEDKKNPYLAKIGKKIEVGMVKKKFSRTRFAMEIETSRPQVNRILSGGVNSSILQLKKICEVLEMDLGELVRM